MPNPANPLSPAIPKFQFPQLAAKPGQNTGKPGVMPSENNEKPPRLVPPSPFNPPPKPNPGFQEKRELEPKPQEANPGPKPDPVQPLVPAQPAFAPVSQFANPFTAPKKAAEGGNDIPAAAIPLTIPKIDVPHNDPKLGLPASPPLPFPSAKTGNSAVVPAKPSFVPKLGGAAVQAPLGGKAPGIAAAPMPQAARGKPGSVGDLVSRVADGKDCVCKKCRSPFKKRYTANSDYDKQFEDFCSEDCAIDWAISQAT
jgi:hypothetical protein